MRLAKEEIFGPLAPVFSFKSEDEVVDAANNCEVGLAAYVYTQDVNRVVRVTETLQFGMVGVNTGVISDAGAP